tara:strand:+ start:2688 stop:3395 length:708 start_codon:yes stop_codon:yes gene_type:complete
MAGKYERFKLFGNKIPKYLVPLGKNTVLWHVINSLPRKDSINVFFIANNNDVDFFPVISSIVNDFGIEKKNIRFIQDTKSQLETATLGLELIYKEIDDSLPISFMNIDTILLNRSKHFDILEYEDGFQGLIDTFTANSNEYSYADTTEDGQVLNIVDKTKISQNACSGLYSFKESKNFLSLSKALLDLNQEANFTSFYKSIIEKDYVVQSSFHENKSDTIVLGTPEEYVTNLHRF